MGFSFLAIVASRLVVIYDLDFRRTIRRPDKAHPESIIDPDRVLPPAITRERLKAIAWR